MAVSSSPKKLILHPDLHPLVNVEVDLNTQTSPLYCCTVPAISGHTIAVVQVGREGGGGGG